MKEKRLKSFHFNCGNSTDGPVGFCVLVKAFTKKEALKILRERILDTNPLEPIDDQDHQIEYANAYINVDNITIKDIDDWEWADDDED